MPISDNNNPNEVYSPKQNTFKFTVYCTIKTTKGPDNVPVLFIWSSTIIVIKKRKFQKKNDYLYLDTETDMTKK
jgi:hypothetical protein